MDGSPNFSVWQNMYQPPEYMYQQPSDNYNGNEQRSHAHENSGPSHSKSQHHGQFLTLESLPKGSSIQELPFSNSTVAGYLLWRLYQLGMDHIFGVPGDFAMGIFELIEKSPIKYVGMCNELNAGYAADGYARIKGIGAVAVTYAVGELSAMNAIAGAFSERVPVVLITGTPPTESLRSQPLLHHTLGDYKIPFASLSKITCAQTLLDDPSTAPAEIDRVLSECMFQLKPVYIAIPGDIVFRQCKPPSERFQLHRQHISDSPTLQEAVQEAVYLLNHASKPVIIGDVMVHRYKLQHEFKSLVERSGIPFVTMMMGKGLIDEHHPQFAGLYEGKRSRLEVEKLVEQADCVLVIGAIMTDLNTGGFTAKLDPNITITVNEDSVCIRYHKYTNIFMGDFLKAITSKVNPRQFNQIEPNFKPAKHACKHRPGLWQQSNQQKLLATKRFFDLASQILPENSIVIAETGESLFSMAETLLPPGGTFIAQVFYGAIGYTVGATVGVCTAVDNGPKRQVFLFVGDGSFQISAQDVSTMVRMGYNPTIFVLNNDGYTIERCIMDGSYNSIPKWHYHLLPLVFGAKAGFDVHTEGDLERAVHNITSSGQNILHLVEVHVDRFDCSDTLKLAGRGMAEMNQFIKQ